MRQIHADENCFFRSATSRIDQSKQSLRPLVDNFPGKTLIYQKLIDELTIYSELISCYNQLTGELLNISDEVGVVILIG